MGFEVDEYVYPASISRKLVCAICQGVLESPVITPCEHLFCEDELVEWLARSDQCPVCKAVVDPKHVQRPSRIIVEMLDELQVRCCNHARGCDWTGTRSAKHDHVNYCEHTPATAMLERIRELEQQVKQLKLDRKRKDATIKELEAAQEELADELKSAQVLLRFFEEQTAGGSDGSSGSGGSSGGSRDKPAIGAGAQPLHLPRRTSSVAAGAAGAAGAGSLACAR